VARPASRRGAHASPAPAAPARCPTVTAAPHPHPHPTVARCVWHALNESGASTSRSTMNAHTTAACCCSSSCGEGGRGMQGRAGGGVGGKGAWRGIGARDRVAGATCCPLHSWRPCRGGAPARATHVEARAGVAVAVDGPPRLRAARQRQPQLERHLGGTAWGGAPVAAGVRTRGNGVQRKGTPQPARSGQREARQRGARPPGPLPRPPRAPRAPSR
jgi:hypothetical protein